MGKKLIITEKPSVARQFAAALGENMKNKDGYMESDGYVITWCVGHLVTMCYPDAYDPALKKWSLDTIPFIPSEYKYQIIDNVRKQFEVIKKLFHRDDIDVIYNAGDSGREGEYIQRLVRQEAGYNPKIVWKRVWIDSQTEDEIRRGINEAKDMSEYDNLSDAAYLRAKEDYLMGINFSRALTLKYSYSVKNFLGTDKCVISVGRVMTCVQGMVVKREREIRDFVKTPFYKLIATFSAEGTEYTGEWRISEGSAYNAHPKLYKTVGFADRETAGLLCAKLNECKDAKIVEIERKKNVKKPPLLYNLAELQNDCSKLFKISPDETLKIAQELYEKKLTTYPRTDARVLSSAVAGEIIKNLNGLKNIGSMKAYVEHIISTKEYEKLKKSRFVDDKQITDHYAIIPTGEGLNAYGSLSDNAKKVYEIIVRRFLAIFYPGATYQKVTLKTELNGEIFASGYKTLIDEGYLAVMKYSFADASKGKNASADASGKNEDSDSLPADKEEPEQEADEALKELLTRLKKNTEVAHIKTELKEGETTPPKRYNSGSIILAMENAGQLIEDEELREQIKGSGIGTSATRAEILKKLVNNGYLALNKKTQIITPTLMGEIIYEVVDGSIKALLDPKLTASWEKGLTGVAGGTVSREEYIVKLNDFVTRRTDYVKKLNPGNSAMMQSFDRVRGYYK